jgi:hypothetical protein
MKEIFSDFKSNLNTNMLRNYAFNHGRRTDVVHALMAMVAETECQSRYAVINNLLQFAKLNRNNERWGITTTKDLEGNT